LLDIINPFLAIHRIRQWQDHKSEVEKVIETNMKKSEPCEEAMLLKAASSKMIEKPHFYKAPIREVEKVELSSEPTPAPRLNPISDKTLVKGDTFVRSEAKENNSDRNSHDDNKIEIQDSSSKPRTPQTSLEKKLDIVQTESNKSIHTSKGAIEKEVDVRKIKEKENYPEKSNTVQSQLSTHSKSLSQKTNKSEASGDSSIHEENKHVALLPTKDFSIHSEEPKPENREISTNKNQNPRATSDIVMSKSKSLPPPIPKPRSSPSRKAVSLETPSDQSIKKGSNTNDIIKVKNSELREEKSLQKNPKQNSLQKVHAQKPITAEEDSVESSGSEEFSDKEHIEKDEDENDTEDEAEDDSQNESEMEEEESVEDEESEDRDESQADDNEEGDGEVTEQHVDDDENEETHSDYSGESNEEQDDSKHDSNKQNLSKEAVSHQVEVHQRQPDLSTNETSQDSEGVVMLKSPTNAKKTSISSKDKISISIAEFKATKGAKFLKNKNIEKLYVEYKFLDLPPEELETPSFPKPKAGGESFKLNFTKIISVDRAVHSKRRRKLVKLLTSEPTGDQVKEGLTDSTLVFTLVSEPPEDKEDQDCEDVGMGKIDLRTIVSTGQDIVDMTVDVCSSEAQSRVSRLLNTGNKPIATLIISIEASEAFKSLRLK
jgi:hypothetical protein